MGDQTGSSVSPRRTDFEERLETVEQRVELLENTLREVVKETGDVSISGPCKQCERCLQIVDRGSMYCPKCSEGRPV